MDPSLDSIQKVKKKLPKDFNGHHLNVYDIVRKNIKTKDLEEQFIIKVSEMLSVIDKKDVKYNEECVKFVCECAELYFLDKGCGELKLRVVTIVLMPYFNDDEELIHKFVQLCINAIRKSNILRRNYVRLRRIFFSLVNRFFYHH